MLQLGKKLTTRIRQMNTQRSLLSLPKVSQRVCHQLWLLKVDVKNSEVPRIENLPTHMEIAIMLNLSRETITRVFQQLQKKNIVAREGPKKLLIQKPEELEKVAKGLIDI